MSAEWTRSGCTVLRPSKLELTKSMSYIIIQIVVIAQPSQLMGMPPPSLMVELMRSCSNDPHAR